jgi:hypothetical protein
LEESGDLECSTESSVATAHFEDDVKEIGKECSKKKAIGDIEKAVEKQNRHSRGRTRKWLL